MPLIGHNDMNGLHRNHSFQSTASAHSQPQMEGELHAVTNVCMDADDPEVRYVRVGDNRGMYARSAAGQFFFVGPGGGDFDKEHLPAQRGRTTMKYFGMCGLFICLIVGGLAVGQLLSPKLPFDCAAGMVGSEVGWSAMRKEFCCENMGVGCQDGGQFGVPIKTQNPTPQWLKAWMNDFTMTAKFLITGSMLFCIGCFCGMCWMNNFFKKAAAPRRSPTELELGMEIKKIRQRVGGTLGEITATLTWDTKDDLDLHLKLPDGKGTISVEDNLELFHGKLDIDGNSALERVTVKPVESICWPPYAPEHEPPHGTYELWVKVFQRYTRNKDISLTVQTVVGGHEELHHRRVVDGCHKVKICNFVYAGPSEETLQALARKPKEGQDARRGG